LERSFVVYIAFYLTFTFTIKSFIGCGFYFGMTEKYLVFNRFFEGVGEPSCPNGGYLMD
jgi:hypothetical protein